MTPEANQRLPAAAQATAAMAMLRWTARLLGPLLPAPGTELRAQSIEAFQREIAKIREKLAQMTFPEMNPVESDMWSQEAVEAFDNLASVFMEQLTKA